MARENFLELYKFIRHWENIGAIEVTGSGRTVFNALIVYKSAKINVTDSTEITVVRLSGPDDGKISLRERGRLISSRLHLDFLPDYQTYRYLRSKRSLRITGESEKLCGKYRVEILPIQSN